MKNNIEFEKKVELYLREKRANQEQKKGNYIDLLGAEKRLNDEWENKVSEHNRKVNEARELEQAREFVSMQELREKAYQSEIEERKRTRDREIEAEKAEAIRRIEDKYDSKGLKSAKALKLDEGYKSLLKNLPGLDDE